MLELVCKYVAKQIIENYYEISIIELMIRKILNVYHKFLLYDEYELK